MGNVFDIIQGNSEVRCTFCEGRFFYCFHHWFYSKARVEFAGRIISGNSSSLNFYVGAFKNLNGSWQKDEIKLTTDSQNWGAITVYFDLEKNSNYNFFFFFNDTGKGNWETSIMFANTTINRVINFEGRKFKDEIRNTYTLGDKYYIERDNAQWISSNTTLSVQELDTATAKVGFLILHKTGVEKSIKVSATGRITLTSAYESSTYDKVRTLYIGAFRVLNGNWEQNSKG